MRAVILAAGEGRRMGGPKALLTWGGESLVVAHVRAARAAGCDSVSAVLRASVASSVGEAMVAAGGVVVISHADDALGPAGSIAAFVASSEEPADLIALTPVDVAPDAWDAVATLRAALAAHPRAVAARPCDAGGRRGHPVLLRSEVLDAFRCEQPMPLRDVLRGYGDRVMDVKCAGNAIVTDLDTLADIAAYREAHGRLR